MQHLASMGSVWRLPNGNPRAEWRQVVQCVAEYYRAVSMVFLRVSLGAYSWLQPSGATGCQSTCVAWLDLAIIPPIPNKRDCDNPERSYAWLCPPRKPSWISLGCPLLSFFTFCFELLSQASKNVSTTCRPLQYTRLNHSLSCDTASKIVTPIPFAGFDCPQCIVEALHERTLLTWQDALLTPFKSCLDSLMWKLGYHLYLWMGNSQPTICIE